MTAYRTIFLTWLAKQLAPYLVPLLEQHLKAEQAKEAARDTPARFIGARKR